MAGARSLFQLGSAAPRAPLLCSASARVTVSPGAWTSPRREPLSRGLPRVANVALLLLRRICGDPTPRSEGDHGIGRARRSDRGYGRSTRVGKRARPRTGKGLSCDIGFSIGEHGLRCDGDDGGPASQYRLPFHVARVVETKRRQAPPFARTHTHTQTQVTGRLGRCPRRQWYPAMQPSLLPRIPSPRKKKSCPLPCTSPPQGCPQHPPLLPVLLVKTSPAAPTHPPLHLSALFNPLLGCPLLRLPSSASHRCLHSCLAQLT